MFGQIPDSNLPANAALYRRGTDFDVYRLKDISLPMISSTDRYI